MSEQTAETGDIVDEALAELGRQARAVEACSICWASVRPDMRERHLNWHASLVRELDRERLPQVYGGRTGQPAPTTEVE